MSELPNRILELRRRVGLSQEEVAFRVGRSKMQISRLERGIGDLSLSLMRALAEVFGVAPADLLSDEDNPSRLADEERRLVARYREGDDAQRDNMVRVAEALIPYRHRDAA